MGWSSSSSRSGSSSATKSVQKQEKPKASVIDQVKEAIGGAETKEAKAYVNGYVNGANEMHSTYK